MLWWIRIQKKEERSRAGTVFTRTVPLAATSDPLLCEKLALVDALRDGRTGERKLAEQELKILLRKKAGNGVWLDPGMCGNMPYVCVTIDSGGKE